MLAALLAFLELFTKGELESLAEELRLRKALGAQYKKLREGKPRTSSKVCWRQGIEYQGLVPKVMRYPRKRFQSAASSSAGGAVQGAAIEPAPPTKHRPCRARRTKVGREIIA